MSARKEALIKMTQDIERKKQKLIGYSFKPQVNKNSSTMALKFR